MTDSTTPTPAGTAAPSTRVEVGDIVLVKVDAVIRRPMIVTRVARMTRDAGAERRLSGTIFCEPDDYNLPVFRAGIDTAGDPARIHGRPDRLLPLGYGELLAAGHDLGQWITRPTNSPSGR